MIQASLISSIFFSQFTISFGGDHCEQQADDAGHELYSMQRHTLR